MTQSCPAREDGDAPRFLEKRKWVVSRLLPGFLEGSLRSGIRGLFGPKRAG